ncbi:MAG: exopolyphosphatase [Magnetococcales bacterium]|nr:exopolyphosphatase [Magnetococcales bacterium]MBF0420021.1 exopolyphosphatase [Magnetococcales bacterium]
MKLAAIDCGSNAVRLLISNVFEVGEWQPFIRKADLYRVPVRLGEDAFVRGMISKERIKDFIHAMTAFKALMAACHVDDYLACATSAMRTAENGPDLVKQVRHEVGLDIQIIDGSKEAELIALNRLDGRFLTGNFLYIDVGGGSTELTLYQDGKLKASKSFKIGTIRIKEGLVSEKRWLTMKQWIEENCHTLTPISAIGSGGNINKLFSLSNSRPDKPVSLKRILQLHQELSQLSIEERMVKLGLKPDRADVIVPAGQVYTNIMQWSNIQQIFVPQIGLSDGLIHALYQKKLQAKTA